MREVVLVDLLRTPVAKGRPDGALSGWHPVDLLSEVLIQVVGRAGIESSEIDDVIAGCVSQVGEQSMNVARSAVLAAGFDESVPGTTIGTQPIEAAATEFDAGNSGSGDYDNITAAADPNSYASYDEALQS